MDLLALSAAKNEAFKFLSSHDIAAITATKLGCRPGHLLPSHTVHAFLAREDQGLLLAVRTDLNVSSPPWSSSLGGSGAIWVQFSLPGGGLQFFVGVCSLPPVGSEQLRVRRVERRLESLAKEAIAADASGYVLLGGNFNAEVGGLSSPALQDGSLPDRGSSCAAVDDHGRKLVEFLRANGLDAMHWTGARRPGSAANLAQAQHTQPCTRFSSPGVPFQYPELHCAPG